MSMGAIWALVCFSENHFQKERISIDWISPDAHFLGYFPAGNDSHPDHFS